MRARMACAAAMATVMAAMAAAEPALAATGTVRFRNPQEGTAVPAQVCRVVAGEAATFEWRGGGACWVVHPTLVPAV